MRIQDAPRFPAGPKQPVPPGRRRRPPSNATRRRESGTAGRRSRELLLRNGASHNWVGRAPAEWGLLVHRVTRRRHPEQLLDPHDLGRASPIDMSDDREIDVAVLHPLDQILRRLAHHRHLGFGIGPREARQDLRQIAIGVIVGNPSRTRPTSSLSLKDAMHSVFSRTIRRA